MSQTQTQTQSKPRTAKLNGAAAAVGHSEIHTEHDRTTFERAYARYEQARDEMLAFFKMPSWKRQALAIITSFVGGFVIGAVGGILLDWLLAGAVLAGASVFVQMLIYALGVLIVLRAAWNFGRRVGGAILTGEADERAIAAYDATREFIAKINPFKRAVAAR